MIIDSHGHYTTAPDSHNAWRQLQVAAFHAGTPTPSYHAISDEEIIETIESNQLRLLKERGADLTLFSPRASAMEHHVGDQSVSLEWSRACNDLIARVTHLFPSYFAGVGVASSPSTSLANSLNLPFSSANLSAAAAPYL